LEDGRAFGSGEIKEHGIGKDLASIASTHRTGVKFLATKAKGVRLRKVKKLPQDMEMQLDEMLDITGSKKKRNDK
jgi:DNA-binding Xre family transcriptional regulator